MGLEKINKMENYYYISQEVLDAFPETKVSKAILDGHGDKSYIGIIPEWSKIEEFYSKEDCPIGFFAYELVDSKVDLNYKDIDYDDEDNEIEVTATFNSETCREYGLLTAIEMELGITKEQNIAYTLFKMAESENVDPIQLVNNIV